jgi:hypothetical protein
MAICISFMCGWVGFVVFCCCASATLSAIVMLLKVGQLFKVFVGKFVFTFRFNFC